MFHTIMDEYPHIPGLIANSSMHWKIILEIGLTIILITVNLFIMLNTFDLKTQTPHYMRVGIPSRNARVVFGWHFLPLLGKSLNCYPGTQVWELSFTTSILFQMLPSIVSAIERPLLRTTHIISAETTPQWKPSCRYEHLHFLQSY